MKTDFFSKRLVLVFITYTDNVKQVNCFMSLELAKKFIKGINLKYATNIKKVNYTFVDAIYPIINYSTNSGMY